MDSGLEFIQWNSVNGEALPWVSQPDNIKSFFETGITTNNNVSFSKGGDGYSGRLSIGLTDQKGVLHNTDLKKYNIGGRVDFDLSDKWTAGLSVNYIKTESGPTPMNTKKIEPFLIHPNRWLLGLKDKSREIWHKLN